MENIFDIGDEVICKPGFLCTPDGWQDQSNGGMGYKEGLIGIIREITGSTNLREERGGIAWFAGQNAGIFIDALEYATEEAKEKSRIFREQEKERIRLEKEKQEKERQERLALAKEKLKELTYEPEDVYALACSIFGEEFVDLDEQNKLRYDIIIHFPEITITNTSKYKHLIKDLYTKFSISLEGLEELALLDYKADILFLGKRGTLSYEEYNCGYRHSHLDSHSNSYTCFCTGSTTPFKISMENVIQDMTEEAWMMLFLGVKNFVSWESEEGGPYINISDIEGIDDVPIIDIQEDLEDLAHNIPMEVWEWKDQLSLIKEHPSLYNFLNKNGAVRDLGTREPSSEQMQRAERDFSDGYIDWKGEKRPISIYTKKKEKTPQMDKLIFEGYCNVLEDQLKQFNKNLIYDQYKSKNYEKVFRASGTEQQALFSYTKNSERQNRFSAQKSGAI